MLSGEGTLKANRLPTRLFDVVVIEAFWRKPLKRDGFSVEGVFFIGHFCIPGVRDWVQLSEISPWKNDSLVFSTLGRQCSQV